MHEDSTQWDSILGYGGMVLAVVAFASQFPDFGADPEVVTSVAGLSMVAWMIAISVRHVRVHPRGEGRGWLIGGWILLGASLAFAVLQAVDTAAFDDGVLDGLLSLATEPPRVVLMLPLLLASWAIIRDAGPPMVRRGHLASPG